MIPILSSLTEYSILQQPQSQSQFLGREAVFHCTIEVAEIIVWKVNERPFSGSRLGLESSTDTLNSTGPVKASNLTVSATMAYHENDISCIGLYINNSKLTFGDTSQQAVLKVQGMFIHVQIHTQGLILACRV